MPINIMIWFLNLKISLEDIIREKKSNMSWFIQKDWKLNQNIYIILQKRTRCSLTNSQMFWKLVVVI